MNLLSLVVPLVFAAGVTASAPPQEPLVCRLDALSASERERHQHLTEALRRAATETSELPTGYAMTLDLSRLPADAKGFPFCVVEVAEWVDLESRCCPFLNFEISLRDKGRHVTLRLTGGENVKTFLREELGVKR
jgi:hypothetical protein